MTDYLEPPEGGQADALLEAERRLEDLLAAAGAPAAEALTGEAGAEARAADGAAVPSSAGGGAPEAAPEQEEFPLLGELESLEAASKTAAELAGGGTYGAEGRRRGRGWDFPSDRGGAEAGGGLYEGTDGRGFALPGFGTGRGESAIRAEELDRAFSRDSRRYDGGFFLY